MRQHTVLFVDDESHVLGTIKRLLQNEAYGVITANSGAEALELLAKQPVSLIVTDQRMPEMSGLDLLKEAKARFPGAIRMIITGYADLEVVIKAINEGEVYRFIPKPWNDEDLKLTVRQALVQYDTLEDNRQLLSTVKMQRAVITEAEQKFPGVVIISNKLKDGVYIIEQATSTLEELMQKYLPKKGNNNHGG
jgi:response regulator RpfG family c-di-GMP phosphodiesterase